MRASAERVCAIGRALQQAPRDEHVQRARDLRDRVPMRDRGRAMGTGRERVVGRIRVHECDGQDPHQRPVTQVSLPSPASGLRRLAVPDPRQRLGRRVADVELAVPIGRVDASIGPVERAPTLVLDIEPAVQSANRAAPASALRRRSTSPAAARASRALRTRPPRSPRAPGTRTARRPHRRSGDPTRRLEGGRLDRQ